MKATPTADSASTPAGLPGLGRRKLVRWLLAGGALGAGILPLLRFLNRHQEQRAGDTASKGVRGKLLLSPTQRATLAAACALVLPSEVGSPGANELGAIEYLEGALAEPRADPEALASLSAGADRLEALAKTRHAASFSALSSSDQEPLLRDAQEDDAEWVSVLIVFALESTLSDPIYGGNRDGAGWGWLGLTPAEPRPTARWHEALAERDAAR